MAVTAATADVGVAQTASQLAPSQVAAPYATNLEDAFWACDYVATTRGTSAAPTEYCAAIYDQIKATKFDGDFDKLLAWWQANKAATHQIIAETLAARPTSEPHATPSVDSPVAKQTPNRLMTPARIWLARLASALRNN